MLQREEHAHGVIGFRSPALAAAGVPHFFTTRHGAEADPARVCGAAGARDLPLYGLRQVHAAAVLESAGPLHEPSPEADGHWTRRADRVLVVVSADCVPVLLARRDGSRVAAVHAGWRGLVAGVLPNACAALAPAADASEGDAGVELIAAVGACISSAHFEVGPEVAERFVDAGLSEVVLPAAPGGRPHVDLRAAAELQLARAGVAVIDSSPLCTYGQERDFPSYRRDVTHGGARATGRLRALIATRAAARDYPAPRNAPGDTSYVSHT